MNTEKKLEKIVKSIQSFASKDDSRSILKGIYLETYDNAEHGFRASITATDGHALASYYMDESEYIIFTTTILPKYFNNGDGVLFTTYKDAADSKNLTYPNYRQVIPTRPIIQAPVLFSSDAQKRAVDFLKLFGDAGECGAYIPTLSTNTMDNGQIKGATARIGMNYIVLVMPIRFTGKYASSIPEQKLFAITQDEQTIAA